MKRVALCLLGLAGCDQLFELEHVDQGSGGGSDAAVDSPRPDGEPMNCPAEYNIRLQTTASVYRLVTDSDTWINAEADCADDMPTGQTHLMVLSTRGEWEALITNPPLYLFDDTYIGATAMKNGGIDFKWVTAEDTGGFVVPATLGVPPWEPDQPDSDGACGELRALSGALHDDTCTERSNYICECDGRPEVPSNFQ